jgi:hypothetical protein
MGHVHSNNDFAEDPGLDFTIGAVGLVQLWIQVGEFFHVLKFMFSTSQVVTINNYSRYFHTLGLIFIN